MKNELERLRREHGLKQEDLAQAMGVSRQTICSIENGKYNPSILLAIKIARYFGKNVEDIFLADDASSWKTADMLRSLGIRNGFIQSGGTAAESFIPDFDFTGI